MIHLDLALRGGGITVLLLVATMLWRAPIAWQGRLAILAVAMTQTALLLIKSAQPLGFGPAMLANLQLFASLTPFAITWLIVTIFLDPPWRSWPWLVAALVASVAFYAHLTSSAGVLICRPISVALYGALFGLSLWSTRDDLVECRCRARPAFAASIAGLALILTLSDTMGMVQDDEIGFALIQSAGTLAVVLAFAFWLLQTDAARWPGEVTATPVPASGPVDLDAADPALVTKIKTAMAAEIWREEGLTIGSLARKLAVPEHRLRRAINQGLGHRNFSSFINHARIKAARDALTDPAKMNVTVLEIAYDVGFASVGPFNRAFRAEMGQSPTEYRRSAQYTGHTDSEKSAPIPRNLH